MEYRFTQVQTEEENIKAYAELLSLVFPDTQKFSQAFLKWQYIDNPHGKVVGYDAYLGDELAAHYVTIPVLYSLNNKEIKGLLSLNTATHPKHQGKGLFTQLATKTYELAKSMNYDFVIGVANQNSTHGFLKKLGFYLISPLDVLVGFGNIDLQYNNGNYKMRAVWKKQHLNWRLSNPSAEYFNYKNLLLVPTGKMNIHAVMTQSASAEAFEKPKPQKANRRTWIGIADLKKTGPFYFNLPAKLKPSPLNLIFKDLTGTLPVLKKEEVFFELIDFDAY